MFLARDGKPAVDAVSRDRGIGTRADGVDGSFPERRSEETVIGFGKRFRGKEASRWRGRHCVEAASAATMRGGFFAAPRRHVLVLASLCVAFQGVRGSAFGFGFIRVRG